MNLSPKGSYEGLLLESEQQVVQVNFPHEWSSAVAELASPGTLVKVEVEPRETRGHAAHSVHNLITLSNQEGDTFPTAEPKGRGSRKFSGIVERLNYALHGEVNGAVLNTGDFLHVKPHGAAALQLAVGMKVTGLGPGKPMMEGRWVIEATEVNGVRLEHKPQPKKKAAGKK